MAKRNRSHEYLLDVSTSNPFDSYVDGYCHLRASDVIGRILTGLTEVHAID